MVVRATTFTFGSHTVAATSRDSGHAARIAFPNGYGASIVRTRYTYGGDRGLWEVAVLDEHGHLTYRTPITDDVVGWLDEDQVGALLDQIAALQPGC